MSSRNQHRTRQTLGVVIATVGQRPELKRMLESILAQTRPVQAIRIVVDADDTSLVDAIVRDLSEDLGTVDLKVLSTGAIRGEGVYLVDTGYAYAVNRGLKALDTDLVALLDDDDEIRPEHFAQLEAAMDLEAGRGVAYSRATIVSPDGNSRIFPEGDVPQGQIATSVLIDRHPVLLPATLINCSVLDVVGGLDQSLDREADTDMLVRLGAATGFAAVDDPTYVYYRVSRKAVVNERIVVETATLLRKHQSQMNKRERIRFWDTQARSALRAGLTELGREAAEELFSVLRSPPPRVLVDSYLRVRSRETPRLVKRVMQRLMGPISGRGTQTQEP